MDSINPNEYFSFYPSLRTVEREHYFIVIFVLLGGHKLWKKMSFFVALPAIGLGMLNVYLAHAEHSHERVPFVPYEYMRVRTKVCFA